jgi:hypothetical protein
MRLSAIERCGVPGSQPVLDPADHPCRPPRTPAASTVTAWDNKEIHIRCPKRISARVAASERSGISSKAGSLTVRIER